MGFGLLHVATTAHLAATKVVKLSTEVVKLRALRVTSVRYSHYLYSVFGIIGG